LGMPMSEGEVEHVRSRENEPVRAAEPGWFNQTKWWA
jgi:hypothetical protein